MSRENWSRELIKKRRESSYFQNIFQELKVEDRSPSWTCSFLTAHDVGTVKLATEWIRSPLVIFNKIIRIEVWTFENMFEMVLEIKCWMINESNESNKLNMYFWGWMQENVRWKICYGTNFIQHHPIWFFASFMKCWMKSVHLNGSNILSNIANFTC